MLKLNHRIYRNGRVTRPLVDATPNSLKEYRVINPQLTYQKLSKDCEGKRTAYQRFKSHMLLAFAKRIYAQLTKQFK